MVASGACLWLVNIPALSEFLLQRSDARFQQLWMGLDEKQEHSIITSRSAGFMTIPSTYVGVFQLQFAQFDEILFERCYPPHFEIHQFWQIIIIEKQWSKKKKTEQFDRVSDQLDEISYLALSFEAVPSLPLADICSNFSQAWCWDHSAYRYQNMGCITNWIPTIGNIERI